MRHLRINFIFKTYRLSFTARNAYQCFDPITSALIEFYEPILRSTSWRPREALHCSCHHRAYQLAKGLKQIGSGNLRGNVMHDDMSFVGVFTMLSDDTSMVLNQSFSCYRKLAEHYPGSLTQICKNVIFNDIMYFIIAIAIS